NSGSDTLSGFHDVAEIIDLVKAGLVTQDRIDLAAQRLLVPLFLMGLFEDPYVDEGAADGVLSDAEHAEVALQVQRQSVVLLENRDQADGSGPALPLRPRSTVYVLGKVETQALTARGFTVVDGNVEDRPSAEGADHVLVS